MYLPAIRRSKFIGELILSVILSGLIPRNGVTIDPNTPQYVLYLHASFL